MSSQRPIVIAIIAAGIIIAVGLAIGLAVGLQDSDDSDSGGDKEKAQQYKSTYGTYKYGAIATDAEVCSDIARDVMVRKGGNAMDAAVAASLCLGVSQAQSMGIGGGGFWTIHSRESNEWHAVISRETAPKAATERMFFAPEDRGKSVVGGLAIAVPGDLKGLWEVHKRFGRVPWKTLVRPSRLLCENGVPLTEFVHKAVLDAVLPLENKTGFEEYFDGNLQPKPVGSLIRKPKLAETYRKIEDDPMSFYTGSLAEDIIKDIQERGGILTLEDLKDYQTQWTKPTQMELSGNLTLFSTPPPGSGAIISYILNILDHYGLTEKSLESNEDKILTYHRMVEAFKFAFAKRTELADARFDDRTEFVTNLTSRAYGQETKEKISDSTTHEPGFYEPSYTHLNDAGTSHLSVVDGEGNAVSMTTTVNTYFGSTVVGSRTGIVFNNEMDDFSTPEVTNYFGLKPSEANFIKPGKRPTSSMCPVIVWDKTSQKCVLMVGGSGGPKITTAVAQVIMNTLWFKMPLPQAIDQVRLHHQLLPNAIQLFMDLPSAIKDGLADKGHTFLDLELFSVVEGVHVRDKDIVAVSDFRITSKPAGF